MSYTEQRDRRLRGQALQFQQDQAQQMAQMQAGSGSWNPYPSLWGNALGGLFSQPPLADLRPYAPDPPSGRCKGCGAPGQTGKCSYCGGRERE